MIRSVLPPNRTRSARRPAEAPGSILPIRPRPALSPPLRTGRSKVGQRCVAGTRLSGSPCVRGTSSLPFSYEEVASNVALAAHGAAPQWQINQLEASVARGRALRETFSPPARAQDDAGGQ